MRKEELKKIIFETLKTSPEIENLLEISPPPEDIIGRNIKPNGPEMPDNHQPFEYNDKVIPIEISDIVNKYAETYHVKGSTSYLMDELWQEIKRWARSKGAEIVE